MWFKEVEVNGKRTCVKDQDGKCAYDWSYCSEWTSGLVADITWNWKPIWQHWICEGIGNWKTQECQIVWDCGGSCSYFGGAWCQSSATDIYPNNGAGYAWFNKKEICESAGYMKMSGGGITPCHLYGTMPSPYNSIPGCIGTYGSCAKWTADLKCIVGDYKAVTYHGKEAIEQCSAISDMKPNCTDSSPIWEEKEETVSCTSEWLYDTYFSNDCYIQKTVGDKTCYKKWCDTWYECYVYNQTIPTWVWSYVVAYGWWIACVKETEWWTRTYEQWGCPNTYTDSCPSDSPAWTSCTAQQKANIAICCVQKNGQATQYVCK